MHEFPFPTSSPIVGTDSATRVQAPDGDSFDDMGDITNFPVALITLAVTGLALAFNMGFFVVVGLDFIPLFSIQDHLVFSIGGAVVLLLLLAVMSFPLSFSQQYRLGGRSKFGIKFGLMRWCGWKVQWL